MHRSPASALYSALAASILVIGMVHIVTGMVTNNATITFMMDVFVSGLAFVFCLLASRTFARKRPSLDYWLVGTAAILCGVAITGFNITHNGLFVLLAAAVTFCTGLCSLMRDLDERVKGAPLLLGYMGATCLVYLLTLI